MQAEAEDILKKYPKYQRDKLIPILQEMQDLFGYLPEEAITKTSRHLNLPASKIYGVASFYQQFRFSPKGRIHIIICRGTHCHLAGSEEILTSLEQFLSIKAGGITKDGMFSLDTCTCMGACGLAPVISVNGDYYERLSFPEIRALLEQQKSLYL